MPIDLQSAAQISYDFGRKAVRDWMAAQQKYSPWGTPERHLNVSIFQGLFQSQISTSIDMCDRVSDELPLQNLKNVRFDPLIADGAHPIDLVVLHPLIAHLDGDRDPWGDENNQARGLIEIKKHIGVIWEAQFLDSIDKNPASGVQSQWHRDVEWTLIVILLVRNDAVGIHGDYGLVTNRLNHYSFRPLVPCQPTLAPMMRGDNVDDRWFEVACFGKPTS